MTRGATFLVAGLVLAVACALSSARGGPCARDSSNPYEQCCGLAVYNVRTSYCCNGRVCGTPCGPGPTRRPARRDRRIYTFAFACGERPMDFIDEQTGEIKGLGVEVMQKACKMARKTCVSVYSDSIDRYDNRKQYSLVLNSRWFDVCPDFYTTVDRGRSYAFIGAYAKEVAAFIYAAKGSSISSVSPATQTIGVHGSYWINGECLKRHNMHFKNVIIKHSLAELKSDLESGKIDVAFFPEVVAGGYKKLGSIISCASTGAAFMIRKDMVNEMKWFDKAVKRLVRTRLFKRMCRHAKNNYGGHDPSCV